MRSCIVLGSGRSGTSMVAGALAAAGYHLGENLITPTSSNPKGYFEDRTVNLLNEDLLAQVVPLGPPGRRGLLLPPRLAYGQLWLAALDLGVRMQVSGETELRMRELTRQRPFCLKDPRFCYTLACWRPALVDAVSICVFRDPGRTAASILTDCRERQYLRYVRMSMRRALRTWTAMYEHVLALHAHNGRWAFVHYEQFLDGSAIPRLEGLLETPVDSSFADPTLRRTQSGARVPGRAAALYQRLCSLAGYVASPVRGRAA